MANLKLLQEAIQAFANGEQEAADIKMRQYFIEAASDINKQLEEEMEEECDDEDGEMVSEDFGASPSADLSNDIQYPMEEAEEEPASDEGEVDFTASGDDNGNEFEVSGQGEAPDVDQWADLQDAFAGLQKMFDEITGGGDVDLGAEEQPEGEEDEFGGVDFGDEKVGESYKMKDVAAPDNKSEKSGVNKKSPIAPNAKSPVQGVEPVKIGKNTTPVVDDTFDGADAESFTVPRDNDNVLAKATDVMKDHKEPKNTAAKARSPLPKKAPKF